MTLGESVLKVFELCWVLEEASLASDFVVIDVGTIPGGPETIWYPISFVFIFLISWGFRLRLCLLTRDTWC